MTIPNDAWPDGVVAHITAERTACRSAWVHVCDSFGPDCSLIDTTDFGLEPGTITIRPSAAESDLRRITYDYCIESDWIEDDENDKRLPLERRLQAMVGQLKAQSAREADLRDKLGSFDCLLEEVGMSHLVRDHTREDLRAALLRLRDEREELRARVSRLEETCTGQQIRISYIGGYLSGAEKERDELRAEVAHLSAAEAALRTKAEMWKSIHDDLFNVATQIKAERDQLRAELEKGELAIYLLNKLRQDYIDGHSITGCDIEKLIEQLS